MSDTFIVTAVYGSHFTIVSMDQIFDIAYFKERKEQVLCLMSQFKFVVWYLSCSPTLQYSPIKT